MTDYSDNTYFELFERQRKQQYAVGNTSYKVRKKKLKALQNALENTYRQELREALFQDFKKPQIEVDLTEIYLVVKAIKHACSNLRSWMRHEKVDTPLALLGTSSYIKYEPKGVCLIMSPWNYPVTLTFGPLVSAIAAGNTVILKPSEMTPHTSAVMAKIVKALFDEHEVALIEGEADVAKTLLELPFNHIFFTGSPAVGKLVMSAAAQHLASVTLELGGKSPTIVHDSAHIESAIKNIVWGKYLNNGQTCIAPDYVLVNASIEKAFTEAFKRKVISYYGENAKTSDSYSRVVNNKHFQRLTGYIDEANAQEAQIELGGSYDSTDNYIAPTLISNVSEASALLQEEIFGPILPVKTYESVSEAIDYINTKEKPLALYIYSKDKSVIKKIINHTRAGSTCINSNALQFSNHHLPFGGSNNSGIGKAHGYYGFLEFTNARSVLKRHTAVPIYWLFPPYTKFKEKLANLTIKWF